MLNWSPILLWLLIDVFSTKNNLITLEPFRRFNLGHLARIVWGPTSTDWTECKLTWTWERNKPEKEWNWRPKYKQGYHVVEMVPVSSHNRIGDHDWLKTLCFFCIFTCSCTLFSILVKVWNVSVNFYINSMNGRLQYTLWVKKKKNMPLYFCL